MFRLTTFLIGLMAIAPLICAFDSSLDNAWKDYKYKYTKQYASLAEESHRRSAFEHNVAIIQKHNKEADRGLHSYTMGLNPLSDLTNEEYRKQMLGRVGREVSSRMTEHADIIYDDTEMPPSVNWLLAGYVSPVMDQGKCASSWAISPVGALEGQFKAKTGKLIPLSVQNIVDCVTESYGCYGGFIISAYNYMIKHGIDAESCYPYEFQGPCKFNTSCIIGYADGIQKITPGNEGILQGALATVGPISVVIDASRPSFQNYKEGVYNEPSCSSLFVNHPLLLVGYGSIVSNDTDYWFVKNSFGTDWGQSGYIMMSRNNNNQCGITNMASYPIIES